MEEPWYQKAFGPRYARIYAHRDDREAETAVALVAGRVPLRGARVLDVACGAGRHMKALRRRRARTHGLDLSEELLRAARAFGPAARGDMRRLPFRYASFDGVLNMFTSFGYFEDRADDVRALEEIARVLRPGGWFLLDYLNAKRVLRRLVPGGERAVGEVRVREARSYDPVARILTKEIVLLDARGEASERWTERLFVYSREEIETMLGSVGLTVREIFGDYEGGDALNDSARLIFFSRRTGGPPEERA
ncbi:MAG: class I SAM-dependent methyltransferase [Candidatus Eisenbacteria bacterium]